MAVLQHKAMLPDGAAGNSEIRHGQGMTQMLRILAQAGQNALGSLAISFSAEGLRTV